MLISQWKPYGYHIRRLTVKNVLHDNIIGPRLAKVAVLASSHYKLDYH
jgi:hypothetical protein